METVSAGSNRIRIELLEKDVEIAELKHKLALETIRAEHAEAVFLIWKEAAEQRMKF